MKLVYNMTWLMERRTASNKVLRDKDPKYDGYQRGYAYNDILDDIVNKYNNTYHRTIKMKPVDVKLSMYFDFNKENNVEVPQFKVGVYVRISKYINIFRKSYVSNCSENVFVI